MKSFYTKKEEILNASSHGFGIIMGMVVGVIWIVLCIRHQNSWATFGISLYLFGMLGSYIASTLYHAWPAGKPAKEKLRRWDHAAIYWHIAGSYSPLTLIAMWNEGLWGICLFVFIWTAALIGTFMSFRHLQEHSNMETICFVLMGLSVLVAFKPLVTNVSMIATSWTWSLSQGLRQSTTSAYHPSSQ